MSGLFRLVLSLGFTFVACGSAWAASSYQAVIRLPKLRAYERSAACGVRTDGKGVIGTLRRNRFRAGLHVKKTRKFKRAYKAAVGDCRTFARNTSVPPGAGNTGDTGTDSRTDTGTETGSTQPPQPTPATQTQPPPVIVPPAGTPPPAPPSLPAIPMLSEWKQQMLQYGKKHCDFLKSGTGTADERLAATYYDAEWIFYQIADYTGDSSWTSCAQAAERVYRDEDVLQNAGKVPGYWNFSRGLLEDWMRTKDTQSLEGLKLLAKNASFASDETPLSYTVSSEASREVAYTIMAYLNAEIAGEPRRARLSSLVNQALGHINEWCVAQNAPFVRPFMVALTSHALIQYAEQVGDPRVVPALIVATDWIWNHTWVASKAAFQYTDRQHSTGGTEVAPDLNLLIAPVYAWLYRQTGEARFLERGDAVFAGGVKQAFLNNGKQFNQNYRRSIEFVRLRGGR